MRMKKVLRILCLTLAMITVLSSVAFASSARASKYLSAYHATMFETSDGNLFTLSISYKNYLINPVESDTV